MAKYRATEKFRELGIESSYQGLRTEDYFNLRAGAEVDLTRPPAHLLEGEYIVKVTKNETQKGGEG